MQELHEIVGEFAGGKKGREKIREYRDTVASGGTLTPSQQAEANTLATNLGIGPDQLFGAGGPVLSDFSPTDDYPHPPNLMDAFAIIGDGDEEAGVDIFFGQLGKAIGQGLKDRLEQLAKNPDPVAQQRALKKVAADNPDGLYQIRYVQDYKAFIDAGHEPADAKKAAEAEAVQFVSDLRTSK